MPLIYRGVVLALPAVLAACGGSVSGYDTSQIQALASTAQAVSGAATTYGEQASAATSVTACSGAQGAYDGQVRPMVGSMQEMGPGMDEMMRSMHGSNDGDVACGANAMMAELDRHRATACGSATDTAANAAEAAHHVATMKQWSSHQAERAQEMGSMMGMSGMMGGSGGAGSPAGRCVHQADGSYVLQ